jgi:cupin fold WbuC family metalloprotein
MIAQGPDVFYSETALVTVTPDDLAFLKAEAARSPRLRSRLCAHPDPGAGVHEMVIVHHRDTYVRPHHHVGKSESFHLMEGRALVILFAGDGAIERVIPVGDAARGGVSYFRMPEHVVHSFVIESEWLVFHETTAGPFDRSQTVFAGWAPDYPESPATGAFLNGLRARARAHSAPGR